MGEEEDGNEEIEEDDYIGSGHKPMRINGIEYTVKTVAYGDETLDESLEMKEREEQVLYEPILDWSLKLEDYEAEAEADFLGIPRKHDVWEEMRRLKKEIAKLERSIRRNGERKKNQRHSNRIKNQLKKFTIYYINIRDLLSKREVFENI